MVARRTVGKRLQRRMWGSFNFTMLCGLGLLMALPFFWMLSTSLKVEQQVYLFPPIWVPNPWAWENYRISLFDILPFTRFFLNTVYVTVTATVGAVLSSSMVAFAFARLRWPGRDKVFLLVLATMMVPTYSTIVPRFILFRNLDWVDTFWPLIVPLWFGGSAFFIFLMRQFYMTIPIDLDGGGQYRRLLRVSNLVEYHSTVVEASLGDHHHSQFHGPLERFLRSANLSQHDGELYRCIGLEYVSVCNRNLWRQIPLADGCFRYRAPSRPDYLLLFPEDLCAGSCHERNQGVTCCQSVHSRNRENAQKSLWTHGPRVHGRPRARHLAGTS